MLGRVQTGIVSHYGLAMIAGLMIILGLHMIGEMGAP